MKNTPSLLRPTALVSSLLLAPTLALAECEHRLGIALETAKQDTRPAPLNADGQQFVPKSTLSSALTLDQSCHLGRHINIHTKLTAAGYASTQEAGSEQTAARTDTQTWVHEAYLTAKIPGGILVDLGKKDIHNGYLLFLSPMDILRTPIDPQPYTVINTAGPSWRSSYREGRIGISTSIFLDSGTLEIAAFPALGDELPDNTPVAQLSSHQRNNEIAMGYLAYSTNLWESFNPKLVARASPGQRHTVALGVSDTLSDGVVFTVEAAYSSHTQVRRVRQDAVNQLFAGGFPDASGVFEPSPHKSRQLAAGVRINGPWRTIWIGEFYYQADGYSKADWNRYFQFSKHALSLDAASGLQPYLAYQRLLLSAADSDQRRHVLLGKRYLTLGVERTAEGNSRVGWHASVLANPDDQQSALLNLHLTGRLVRGAEVYLGGRAMLGRKYSEFGRFGLSPLAYLGLNFSL